MLKACIVLLFLGCVVSESEDTETNIKYIKIGAIIYNGSEDLEKMLTLVTEINVMNYTAKLVPIVRQVDHGNIVAAGKHVCNLTQEGVYSIIDATQGRMSAHIQAVCDSLEIPHIVTHYNVLQARNWSVVNLYPSADTYNQILAELIEKKEWQNFTIMYVKGHSIANVKAILELNNHLKTFAVTVRELSGDNYRTTFAEAKKRGSVNFLVDCPANKLTQVLQQAQEVGLMSNKHSYIFTSPDLHTLNLDQFKYGGANVTGFRLINPNDEDVKAIASSSILDGTSLFTNMTLVYDAALVIARAYEKLPVDTTSIVCDEAGGASTWRHGSSVINVMRTNKIKGLTRELLFDSDGQRSNFTFDIFELTRAGLSTVGTWKDGLKITREYIQLSSDDGGIMKNKTFTVLISTTPPYAFVKETVDTMSDNDRYEGFAVDIIDELAKKLGFFYKFSVEQSAGTFKDGKATGMIKKIMNNEADFAISDLTITHERQSAIDFTTPFMSVGISILYKKPSKQPPAMFSFMDPFAKEVWIYMMLAQMVLAFLLAFVGRISHKEWHNPFPCVEKPESLDNQFSVGNAMWLICGSVMQQGSEIAPIALGPRTITSAWWFFTMVMIAYYTGTLVAFLTVESKTLPFNSAEDLGNQNYIQYGAKKGGATLQFFNQSGNELYKAMFKQMSKRDFESCPSDPDGNTKGRLRVQAGRYAFFMESAAIQYELERHCDLMEVGEHLDTKNYGIGMRQNSSYRETMSQEILKMKETGTLQKLIDKWWKERRGGGACTDTEAEIPTQLEMKNMIGAFVVLGVGCILGIVISILDMLWGVYKRTMKYNTTYRNELIEELRFALKFSGDTKPVRKRPKSDSETHVEEEKAEERDELDSLRSFNSSDTHHTRHSNCTHGSSRSQSLAFARRRRYS